ncbi:hypothetical protein H6A07_09425 [Olsenella uli]|uniref:hypothetical protein n=1 Tax=Olsenella uli TaxID=133926 RepID=UPI001956C10E|nr:hypothetical protein [Olsenella uli]MBM6676953.1 hypothetical protein [Olsenella uli]
MAKRNTRAAARKDAAQPRFDDKKYEGVLFSATYECNELALARASETLGQRLKTGLTAASFVSLLLMLVSLLVDNEATPFVIVLFLVSLVLVYGTTRWDRLQLAYARRTVLAPVASGEQRHVAVCEGGVHVENEAGPLLDLDYSDLRFVRQNGDCVVAGFGQRRYVYVPRSAMSENRFRDLGRFLTSKLA